MSKTQTPTSDKLEMGAMSHPLMARITNDPILVDPDSVNLFAANLSALLSDKNTVELTRNEYDEDADDDFWPAEDDEWMQFLRPYNVQSGILVIPVHGSLLNHFPYAYGSWATGYEYIQRAVARGMSDPQVKGIAFHIDSPGGMVSGNFELVDYIYEQRGVKPMRAFAADSAFSAAYSIASAADSIQVTRSGGVGSIGVVLVHYNVEENLRQHGIEVTHIYAGKHKIDGTSYEALTEQARERFQARVDKLYGVFTSTVARNRNMDDKDVRETEALTYDAEESLSVNLADSIGTLDEGLSEFAEGTEPTGGDFLMADKDTGAVLEANDVANEAAIEAARKEGWDEGFAAYQTRQDEIMGLDEAKGREDTAMTLSRNANLSVDAVKEVLATVPAKEAASSDGIGGDAKRNHFAEAMDKDGSPDVPASEEAEDSQAQEDARLDDIFAHNGIKA